MTCQKERVNLKPSVFTVHCILTLSTGHQVDFYFEIIFYSLLFILI